MWTLLLLLLGTPAQAATPDAEALAARAAAVHESSCSGRFTGSVQSKAAAIGAVADVWQQLDDAWAADPQPYLLYWRGLFAQCLEDPAQARQDLSAFVATAGDDSAGMVKEARRRLRLLGGDAPRPSLVPTTTRLLVATGALTGGSLLSFGTLGGLAQQRIEAENNLGAAIHTTEQIDRLDRAARNLNGGATFAGTLGLTAGLAAFGTGVAALVSSSRAQASRAAPTPTFAVVPTAGGAAVVLGGAW